jgi:exopolysaccharide production protein ExoQ
MSEIAANQKQERASFTKKLPALVILGIAVGVVMPVIAALLYPTYRHFVQPAWAEWTRLIELPFVVSEALVIHWALRKGLDVSAMWRTLARDLKIATYVLLVGLFTSSALISAEPLQSLNMSIITIIHLLFALSVFHLVNSYSSREMEPFLFALAAGLIILAILTAFRFAFPPPLSQIPGGEIEWASAVPGFISVRHFGSWTAAITAAFMAMLLYPSDYRRIGWWRFFYFLAAAMTIWSGTRAAIFALIVTALILVLTNRKLPAFRAMAVLSLLTAAAVAASWPLLPAGDPAFQLFRINGFGASEVSNVNQVASGRGVLWAATWDRWLDSPLFGWGTGSVFWEVYVDWSHTQPHNVVLQFLFSWGLVGAAGALWLLGRAVATVQRTALRRPYLHPPLAMLYTLLLMSMLEGMLHYPRFIMLIMILFAVIIREHNRDDQMISERPRFPQAQSALDR